jgi:outer membrane protein
MLNHNYFTMKKISVILYAVVVLAVALLYFFQFSGSKRQRKAEATSSINDGPVKGIAYVNIDSIIFKFDMFADRRSELLTKQKNAEAELTSKGTSYEKAVKDYQEKVSKGLVTRATAAQMEQALTQQQQELIGLRDKLQSSLMEEEQVMNRQIMEYITKFLEQNKSEYNYQYILGKSFGSVVLYSNDSLDITGKVLAALNKKYQAEKK